MNRLPTGALCALGIMMLGVGARAQQTVDVHNGSVTVHGANGRVTHITNGGVVTNGRRVPSYGRVGGRTINGNGRRLTFFANDRPVVINGNRNTLTIRGTCPNFTVNGNRNTVFLVRVGNIEANGNDNRVRYSSSLRGGRANVSDNGTNNRISRQ